MLSFCRSGPYLATRWAEGADRTQRFRAFILAKLRLEQRTALLTSGFVRIERNVDATCYHLVSTWTTRVGSRVLVIHDMPTRHAFHHAFTVIEFITYIDSDNESQSIK